MTDHDNEVSRGIQGSDYDGAWKEALRWHLKEFIEKCFPLVAVQIDWTFEPEWLDKEIGQIIGQAGHRNQEVDLLFKARLTDGRDQWVLCHLEIQSSYEIDFAFRIDLYNSGLKWLFQREVLTLVILADSKPDWRPGEYHFEFGGYRTDRMFPVWKALDHLQTDQSSERSIVVEVARAQIAALRTASDPESRFNVKTELVRNLYRVGYNQTEIREIFRLVDWMMHLRPDLELRFKSELVEYEKDQKMPYITSVERLAKEEGREEGREQGTTSLLLRQLRLLCSQLPEDIELAVHQLSLDQSQALGEALLDFRSIEDLKNWLKTTTA